MTPAEVDAKIPKFIELIQLGVSVNMACKGAKIPRSTVYLRRNEDPAFREQWDEAEVHGVVKAAKEVATTENPVRLKAALTFLTSHDGKRWRTRRNIRLSGGLNLQTKGLAQVLAEAKAKADESTA